jgi:nicotinamidase-related amidase
MTSVELPVPAFYNPDGVGEVWKVAYQDRAEDAKAWARQHRIQPSGSDDFRTALLLVDVQNTFCIPYFELYVGGTSGTAAVDDNRRLVDFIYRNLNHITQICPTMDTHQVMQIFHSIFLVDDQGQHPQPYTLISLEDIEQGNWKFNPDLAAALKVDNDFGRNYLHHYARQLKAGDKYDLTIWPYHAMLGGIGHALVSAVEEAVFFHSIARASQPDFEVKGSHPFTENYSVLQPEVLADQQGKPIAQKNLDLIHKLMDMDAVIIGGQAKSHCVAWTIDDLLVEIQRTDKTLAEKVYLLEDCSSPVVIPEVIDYTEHAEEAFKRFEDEGMHVVRSMEPMADWPGMQLSNANP